MTWDIGEIAESGPQDGRGTFPVRIIHVSEDKVIAAPHMNMSDPIARLAAKIGKIMGVDYGYAQMEFDPATGKQLKPHVGKEMFILKKKQ